MADDTQPPDDDFGDDMTGDGMTDDGFVDDGTTDGGGKPKGPRHAKVDQKRSKKPLFIVLGIVALLCAGAAAALFFLGGDETTEVATTTTTEKTTTTTAPPIAPLTGLPVDDEEIAERASIEVKIDNHPDARPQSGLEFADVVFEEQVEGGLVRFMAVFHSQDADPVGPVRSTRAVDPKIAWPLGGLFAYSGGTEQNVELLREAPITDVGHCCLADAYYRSDDKDAPHNLFTSTEALRAGTTAETIAPPLALFTYFGEDKDFAPTGVKPATSVIANISEAAEVQWDYDTATEKWLRTTNGEAHVMASGVQLSFDNVIIQYVEYTGVGGDANIIGSGEATVLVDGKAVTGTWERPTVEKPTVYKDSAGKVIAIKPGTTWVTLAPAGTPTTIA